MILTFILLCTLALLTVVTLTAIVFGGGVFVIVFGDVLVFVLVLVWIFKKLFKKNNKNK